MGLQILQGQPQVQNGLGTGADHHHGGVGQLLQVGGDVESLLGAPVHTADTAGGEYGDPRHVGDDHGGGDGGGAVPTLCHQHRQIPAAGLGNGGAGLAQVVDFLRAQARFQPAADDRDGGGDRTVVPNNLLHVQRCLHILGIGHAVGDDGGLQSHHRAALIQGLAHFRRNVKILVEHENDSSVYHEILKKP